MSVRANRVGPHRACPDGESDWQAKEPDNLLHLPRKAAGVRTSRNAFTLLEALSVIAIITLLAGLLFPAAHLIRESAQRRLAQQRAQGIIQAIKQYRNLYGQWPGQTQGAGDWTYTNCAPLILALTNNPRNVVFLQDAENVVSDTAFLDPWNRPYVVAVDENGDGTTHLSVSDIATNIADSVAVASWGPDTNDVTKRVYSWTRK